MPRNTAASKIGNGVISLLWQLRCHCNPHHNKFSSLSNTTVVLIFLNLCLWRRSLPSNLGGIDPEKLYRATLTSHLSPSATWHKQGAYSFPAPLQIWLQENLFSSWKVWGLQHPSKFEGFFSCCVINRWSEIVWWPKERTGVTVWVAGACSEEKLYCGQSGGRKSKVFIYVSSLHFSQKTARLSSSLTSCLDLNNDKLMSEMKPWLIRAAEIQI